MATTEIQTWVLEEELEDTKEGIRTRKSTDRQLNCQKKKDKRRNNDLQHTTQKIKIEQHEPN